MAETQNRGSGLAAFATAIFISSFLIFQVQPMIGKFILPWFGGTPAVWSTCLLFFQVVLFAGYAYAHLLIKFFSVRFQCVIHFAALIIALATLPITPDASWKPLGNEDPTLRILGLLAVSVGLPYFLLSANGPLLQAWFSRANPGRSPYGLYSLSNVGSLLGLISYPFLIEPRWSVDVQASTWSWGFGLFALTCVGCAAVLWRIGSQATAAPGKPSVATRPQRGVGWLWFAFSTCGSVMLLATTNQVCIDVAAVPFLWVVPLTLYLITFIIAFANPRWYPRLAYAIAFVIGITALCIVMADGARASIAFQAAAYFGVMFVCCMICHGEMVRLKPEPERLTAFYMLISAGGAAGGIFVALLAPMLFSRFYELQIGAFACCVLVVIAYFRDSSLPFTGIMRRALLAISIVSVLIAGGYFWVLARGNVEDEIMVQRNFFGVMRISEYEEYNHKVRELIHGRIVHGVQVLSPEFQGIPISYYSAPSGAGILMSEPSGPRKIGVVGLGAGTLASFGREGDTLRFYEINADVISLAQTYFTFLQDSPAHDQIQFSLGDARLSLERESPQGFDCLLVDAFSSDAIPTHLLTSEAFEIYLRHLADDGVLAVHISNRHFDLLPVVRGAARKWNLTLATVSSRKNDEKFQFAATWVLLARQSSRLEALNLASLEDPSQPNRDLPSTLWTDNFSNLLGALRPPVRASKKQNETP